jgi:hypothetical protein
MSDIDRRKKMISLRLSEVEYDDLKTHYRAYGVRNVSELARLALERMMNESSQQQDGVAAKLSDLDERVHQLESRVSLLLEREKVMS